MSSSCDGAEVKKKKGRKASVSANEDSEFADPSWKSVQLEDGFRGFERAPVVVLPRFDLTPYLKDNYNQVILNNSTESDILSHFTRKCFVKLDRDDLKPLVEALAKKTDSQESDSDTDTEGNMSLKCKICEKSYASEKKLLNHLSKKHIIFKEKPRKKVSFSDHVIVHEVHEYHKCRKCTRIFKDYKSLKRHMKERHKKRKCYICNYCNKNFVDRMFFKVHIKLHCDVCGVFYPNRAKYLQHRRDSCRVFKLHKCKTCSLSFFNIMHLKDHSYEHTNISYVCDVCKDQFVTKCAIAHHILFLHSSKRPESMYTMRNLGTERLYLCNFCDISSVDKDLIEAHIQTLPDLTNRAMTGYKDYYFCDQCFKKFETETSMLQHKWSHFLKTTDNSQERKKGILLNRTESKYSDPGVYSTEPKVTYSCHKVPEMMQPKVILERIPFEIFINSEASVDLNNKSICTELNKPIVDPKSKKTIISRHQCQICDKYYSSNYCLMRHIDTQHSDYENLRCNVCEETFAWPSLLKNHKCVRIRPNETHFDDNRPEVHFDNLHEIVQNGFDDIILGDSDYINSQVDFEIPAPISELTERGDFGHAVNFNSVDVGSLEKSCLSNGYKLIMQEVPIEF